MSFELPDPVRDEDEPRWLSEPEVQRELERLEIEREHQRWEDDDHRDQREAA